MRRAWAALRAVLAAAGAYIDSKLRWLMLRGARGAGVLMRWTSRGWLPSVRIIAGLAIVLAAGPMVINRLSSLAGHLGLWSALQITPPHARHWLTVITLVATFAALVIVRWFVQARQRVVVEDFVDYTSDAAKAVSGLSTLLVAELGRLRNLYQHVNEQLSVSRSVGVSARSGSGSAAEPGSFLTVRADELSDVLSGAVASEGDLQVGVFRIPIGTLLALVGRLFKGPRLLGSVHLTEAGGGPMLTAQIVGRGSSQSWRVDLSAIPQPKVDRAFLDPMVSELACRMFTDLTLRGSVRWRAIGHFTEYLHLYSESRRTPKNRARFLRQAETALLEAISEDEAFGLAYYNLGVIYGQLAAAERRGADAGALGRPAMVKQQSDPDAVHQARIDAALAAFEHALDVTPGSSEPMYALAVHRYSRIERELLGPDLPDERELALALEQVVQLCGEVLKLDRRNPQAHDLRGLARRRLVDLPGARDDVERSRGLIADSMADHRAAVRAAWMDLCRAEYREHAHPPTTESLLPRMRANASAALRNLALGYQLRGVMVKPPEDHPALRQRTERLRRWRLFWCADFVFRQSLRLAPPATLAVTQFERGVMLEAARKPAAAVGPYSAATKLESDNPLYHAHLARAMSAAGRPDGQRHACEHARRALDVLAPIFRRALEPYPLRETVHLRDATLEVLGEVYEKVEDGVWKRRIARIRRLADGLAGVSSVAELDAFLDDWTSGAERAPDWERFQIDLARARLLEGAGCYEQAEGAYEDLIAGQMDTGDPIMAVPMLHARRAKVLRKLARRQSESSSRRALLQKALDQAAQGVLRDPLNPMVRREMGKEHFALEQYSDALEVWGQTLALTPNDPYLSFKLGLCHWHVARDRRAPGLRTGDLQGARAAFDNARLLFGLECIEQWTWSQLWRGRVALELGDVDAAIPELRAAANFGSTHLAAELLLGESYRRAGDEAMSYECFSKLLADLEEERCPAMLDDDWGNTLSRHEAQAWAGWAVAVSPAAPDPEPEGRLVGLEIAKAAAGHIPDERNRTHWTAQCLDAEARLRTNADLAAALTAVELAGALILSPEITMHQLELYELKAARVHDPHARMELYRRAAQAVRKLKRLELREHEVLSTEAEQILGRLQVLTTPGDGNGARRRRTGARG